MAAVLSSPLVAVLVALGLAAGWGGAAPAPRPPSQLPPTAAPLAAARLLVAMPQVGGPFFGRSVVLLLEYDETGAVGLVVNRPLDIPLVEALPEVEELRGRDHRLDLGGPVERARIMLLVRAEEAPPGATRVFGDVYTSGTLETLRHAAAAGLANERLHVHAGYAGWAPGQLDAEVASGGWLVVPADASAIFETPPDALWQDLMRGSGGRWVRR
jgi:putative transcriptional regulator